MAATRENSSHAPRAFWKLPGPGRPPAPRPRSEPVSALASRIVRPPPPTPALYAGHAACDAVDGSETSVLLEPRSTAYDSKVLLQSNSINPFFHLGHAILPAGNPLPGEIAPRDRASQPISLHSRPLEASWRLREIWGAKRRPQRGFRAAQRANQPREWTHQPPWPNAR